MKDYGMNILYILLIYISSVQSLSRVWFFATPGTAACQASPSITNTQSLLKLMSIELVMPSNHLILCRPLLFPPSIFPSIRVFSSESVLHIRWPKYWSFSFSISPSNEYSGLNSFRMDWVDLLEVHISSYFDTREIPEIEFLCSEFLCSIPPPSKSTVKMWASWWPLCLKWLLTHHPEANRGRSNEPSPPGPQPLGGGDGRAGGNIKVTPGSSWLLSLSFSG